MRCNIVAGKSPVPSAEITYKAMVEQFWVAGQKFRRKHARVAYLTRSNFPKSFMLEYPPKNGPNVIYHTWSKCANLGSPHHLQWCIVIRQWESCNHLLMMSIYIDHYGLSTGIKTPLDLVRIPVTFRKCV